MRSDLLCDITVLAVYNHTLNENSTINQHLAHKITEYIIRRTTSTLSTHTEYMYRNKQYTIMNANPVDRDNTLSGKRNCDDFDFHLDIEELLDLPPPSKKERICDKEEEEVRLRKVEEADADDYMQHQHTTMETTLEFSVNPHRQTIGLQTSEVVTQICATIKACELPVGVHARAPVDIVVALDVSGSMVSKISSFYSVSSSNEVLTFALSYIE